MMTNTRKTKAEVILELVLSMNRGNSGSIESRPRFAEQQYKELVGRGIIVEKPMSTTTTSVAEGVHLRPPAGPL